MACIDGDDETICFSWIVWPSKQVGPSGQGTRPGEGPSMGAKTIDEYLAGVSPEQRAALELLRGKIGAAAPGAQECISYGQPALRKGRVVCGFGATKKHCALYLFSDTTLDAFLDDLDRFSVSKGTVRFQPESPIPAALVEKLVKARLAENLALDRTKKEKRR